MADLNIGDLDYGVSLKGAETYKEDLKAIILTEVSNLIDTERQNVIAALDRGWTGVSRKKFDNMFNQKCEELKTALAGEYFDLTSRLNELSNNFIQQDKNMIID